MPGLVRALRTCGLLAADLPPAFAEDPLVRLEHTCFQTGQGWSSNGNLRSDTNGARRN